MRVGEFLKDKLTMILLNISCAIALTIFLLFMGNSLQVISLILIAWIIICSIHFTIRYISRKKYFDRIENVLDTLEEKYLITELIGKPYSLEDKEYIIILKRVFKSMIENVNSIRNERDEYREYIESWVHEVKLPITSIQLLCENNKSDITRKVLVELRKIEDYVDKVLFYARSEETWKDYIIKESDIDKLVTNIISKNIQLFIQNNIQIEKKCENMYVYTDEKWVEFIVTQLLVNSVKYKKECESVIKIYSQEAKSGTCLVIEDNGIGIKDEDLNRIFNKGFVGTNGRKIEKSTGIGLYLCKKLCNKLGLKIEVESEVNNFTKITLIFPLNDFILQK